MPDPCRAPASIELKAKSRRESTRGVVGQKPCRYWRDTAIPCRGIGCCSSSRLPTPAMPPAACPRCRVKNTPSHMSSEIAVTSYAPRGGTLCRLKRPRVGAVVPASSSRKSPEHRRSIRHGLVLKLAITSRSPSACRWPLNCPSGGVAASRGAG